jgi:cell division septum initiation protein DivIVA
VEPAIEPVEIQHVKLARRPIGYAVEGVERLLEDVACSYEDVWRERDELRAEVARLREQLAGSSPARRSDAPVARVEDAGGGALARAQADAPELPDHARVEADRAIADAERSRDALRAEVRRLQATEAEIRLRLRALLTASLDLLSAPERGVHGDALSRLPAPGDER